MAIDVVDDFGVVARFGKVARSFAILVADLGVDTILKTRPTHWEHIILWWLFLMNCIACGAAVTYVLN